MNNRTPLLVAIAFLLGLAIGHFGQRARPPAPKEISAADLAGIEKLRQKDIDATLPQDPQGLADIWADDAVRFNPGNPVAVGKQAIAAENAKFRAEHPDFKVLSYAPKFRDLQMEDGLAWEWAVSDPSLKMSADAPVTTVHLEMLRVMKRQSDGSWKFVMLFAAE